MKKNDLKPVQGEMTYRIVFKTEHEAHIWWHQLRKGLAIWAGKEKKSKKRKAN